MFDEDSQLVKVWVRLVKEEIRTKEEIPNLSNLREIVCGILGKGETE